MEDGMQGGRYPISVKGANEPMSLTAQIFNRFGTLEEYSLLCGTSVLQRSRLCTPLGRTNRDVDCITEEDQISPATFGSGVICAMILGKAYPYK